MTAEHPTEIEAARLAVHETGFGLADLLGIVWARAADANVEWVPDQGPGGKSAPMIRGTGDSVGSALAGSQEPAPCHIVVDTGIATAVAAKARTR